MGTIGFLIPKNIKILTLALLEAKLLPNMWFRWRPFWMCHKTRLRGGKNWTPIFLAYLTPNEAIKTIKAILATEMAKMTYRTRLLRQLQIFQFFQCGDRLYTSESDVYRRQILTSKDGPRTERVKPAVVHVGGETEEVSVKKGSKWSHYSIILSDYLH